MTRLSECPHKTITAGVAFVLSLGSTGSLKITAALWLGWLCPKALMRFEGRRHFPMQAAYFAQAPLLSKRELTSQVEPADSITFQHSRRKREGGGLATASTLS